MCRCCGLACLCDLCVGNRATLCVVCVIVCRLSVFAYCVVIYGLVLYGCDYLCVLVWVLVVVKCVCVLCV